MNVDNLLSEWDATVESVGLSGEDVTLRLTGSLDADMCERLAGLLPELALAAGVRSEVRLDLRADRLAGSAGLTVATVAPPDAEPLTVRLTPRWQGRCVRLTLWPGADPVLSLSVRAAAALVGLDVPQLASLRGARVRVTLEAAQTTLDGALAETLRQAGRQALASVDRRDVEVQVTIGGEVVS